MTAKSKEEKLRYMLDELMVKGNLEAISDHFDSEYLAHAGAKDYSGLSFLKQFSKQLRKAISDIQIVDIEILLQDEDRITWQRTLQGINKSALRGIPASKKKVTWVEMVVTRFKNEKISEEWIVSELMGELLLLAPKK